MASVNLSEISAKVCSSGISSTTRKYIAIGDSYVDTLQSFVVAGIAKAGHALIGRYGYSGKRSDEILSLVRASTAYQSGATNCIISLGMNDLQQNTSKVIMFQSVCDLIDDLRKYGITPEFCYIAQHNTYYARKFEFNAVLFYAAITKGVAIYDVFGTLGTATATWNALYSSDGVHPNALGRSLAAKTLSSKINAGKSDILLCNEKSQSSVIVADAIFSTDTNADGLSDGWTMYLANLTASRESYLYGFKQVLSASNQSGSYIYQSKALAALKGHKIFASCIIDMSLGGTPELSIFIRGGGTDYYLTHGYQSDDTSSIVFAEFTLLDTITDSSLVAVDFKDTSGASSVKIYALQFIDLTALGLS